MKHNKRYSGALRAPFVIAEFLAHAIAFLGGFGLVILIRFIFGF